VASRARPTPARLGQLLKRELPKPLAELLVPATTWRVTTRSVIAVLPNQIWQDLFTQHAGPVLERRLDRTGLQLRIQSRVDDISPADTRRGRLDNFLQDPGNQFALSAVRQVLEAPGLEHNPLYLHGPDGCGKTHLIAALSHEATSVLGEDQVVRLEGHDWVARHAQELAETGTGPLRERIDSAAFLLFDGVEALARRNLAQEQLFHLINNGMERGQQLVLTGDAAPRRLEGLEDRLVTRLGWGLAVAIDPPLLETRIALLRQLLGDAAREHDAAELARMVEALAPDMHQTVRLADRLVRGEPLGIGKEAASFDRVLECVANRYGIRATDIAGKRRHRSVAQARQASLLLGRRLTTHSLEALGGMVGGRDHSTVLYSIRQAEERLAREPEFTREISELTQEILAVGTRRHRRKVAG